MMRVKRNEIYGRHRDKFAAVDIPLGILLFFFVDQKSFFWSFFCTIFMLSTFFSDDTSQHHLY